MDLVKDGPAWIGIGTVILSAATFAGNSTSAVIAYDGGATPLSVTTVRLSFTVVALYALIRFTGGRFRLLPRDRNLALIYGVVTGVQSYALLKSFQLIPVGLAVLTFYLYPILIGVVSHFTGRERLGWRIWCALTIAFIGLAVALDVLGKGVDPLGIAFALFAAITMTALALLTAPIMARTGDSRPVTYYMNLSAAAMFVVVCLVLWDLPLPDTRPGWAGFAAVPVFYAIAITAFYSSIRLIGPVRAGLFMNLEPVASMICGFVILHQILTAAQVMGMVLVVGAVVLVRLRPGSSGQAAARHRLRKAP